MNANLISGRTVLSRRYSWHRPPACPADLSRRSLGGGGSQAKADLSFLVVDCQVRPTRNRSGASLPPWYSPTRPHPVAATQWLKNARNQGESGCRRVQKNAHLPAQYPPVPVIGCLCGQFH